MQEFIAITEGFNRFSESVALEIAKDRSAMDGYAVRAEDTNGATQQKPLLFRFAEGDELADPAHREAKQVWTGNPIPKGANAVVILENTQKKDTKLEVWSQVAVGENIIRRGEDIKKGDIAQSGQQSLYIDSFGIRYTNKGLRTKNQY